MALHSVISILKQKKLQVVFLFYNLLMLAALCPLAQNLSAGDVLALIGANLLVFCMLTLLSVFMPPKTEKLVFSLLLVICIPQIIYIAYLVFSGVLVGASGGSLVSIFETNPEETREFIGDYMGWWVVLVVLLYLIIPIVLVWRMKTSKYLPLQRHKWLFGTVCASTICICSIATVADYIPVFSFYKTFVTYKFQLISESRELRHRCEEPYSVSQTLPDSVQQTIVVVIGESGARAHHSLYGYPRNTDSLLAKRQSDFYAYSDVVSPQVNTLSALRQVLTMYDKEHPEFYTEKPSLFELFNRAGYSTCLISNQSFCTGLKRSVDDLLAMAQLKIDLSGMHSSDSVVFPGVLNMLQSPGKRNKLIVVHLMGNHTAYSNRYPPQFNVFDYRRDTLSSAKYRTEAALKVIDSYDNSILYVDFIVDSLIRQLETHFKGISSLIYLSDHGEEVYDWRSFAGHAYEKVSTYMCEIPFFVWHSSDYLAYHPDMVFDTTRPFSTCDLVYSLSQLAGLIYCDYLPSRSLFSADFRPVERYVGDWKYEDIKARQ